MSEKTRSHGRDARRWSSALLYRARQLGLISEDQHKTGVIRLARGGEARQEHEDGLIPKETPELFAHAISLLGSTESAALRVVAKCLEISPEIVREFLVSSPEPKPPTTSSTSMESNVIEVQFGKRESSRKARPEAIEH